MCQLIVYRAIYCSNYIVVLFLLQFEPARVLSAIVKLMKAIKIVQVSVSLMPKPSMCAFFASGR